MAQGENPGLRPKSARAANDPNIAPPYGENVSSERIRDDIRETRRDMDQTVDALSDRLKPRHLLDELLDWWQQRSGNSSESLRELGTQVGSKLRDHPVSVALIGAGVVWMFFEGDRRVSMRDYRPRKWDVREHSGSYVDARTGEPYDDSYGEGARREGSGYTAGYTGTGAPASYTYGTVTEGEESSSSGGGVGEKARGLAGKAGEMASGATEKMRDAASAAGEKLSGWTQGARERSAQGWERGRDYAGRASEGIRQGYRTSAEKVSEAIEEYPLAVGAGALAAGLIAGLLLPSTRQENRMMGRYSDDLKRRARETGEDLYETGKEVASATANAAADEAQRQGLSPSELAEKGKRVASDVQHAAAESAEREGLNPDQLGEKARKVAEQAKETAKQKAQQRKSNGEL